MNLATSPTKVQSSLKAIVGLFGKLIHQWESDATEMERIVARIEEICSSHALLHEYARGSGINAARDTLLLLFPDLVSRLETKQMQELDRLILQLKSFHSGAGDVLAAMQVECAKAMSIRNGAPPHFLVDGIFSTRHVLDIEKIFALVSKHYGQYSQALKPLLAGWHVTASDGDGDGAVVPASDGAAGLTLITMGRSDIRALRTAMKSHRSYEHVFVSDFLRMNNFAQLSLPGT